MVARYASLGLQTKLKFVRPGERFDHEFVGLHMLMGEHGVSKCWCPDLTWCLSKMTVTVGRENFQTIGVACYCSFALMWSPIAEARDSPFLSRCVLTGRRRAVLGFESNPLRRQGMGFRLIRQWLPSPYQMVQSTAHLLCLHMLSQPA